MGLAAAAVARIVKPALATWSPCGGALRPAYSVQCWILIHVTGLSLNDECSLPAPLRLVEDVVYSVHDTECSMQLVDGRLARGTCCLRLSTYSVLPSRLQMVP